MSISSIGSSSLSWLQQAARAITTSSTSSEDVQNAQEGVTQSTSPAQASFIRLDQDVSGGLDSTEFQLFIDKLNEETGQSLDGETLLTTYDEDGDGTLSGMEMETLLEENRPEKATSVTQGMLSDIFNELDEDGDATLSSSEFEALVSMINEATGAELDSESLLESYDEDGDGLLSEAETVAALEANRPEGPPPAPPVAAADVEETSDDESETSDDVSTVAAADSDLLSQLEELVSTYDADGDGALSEDELLTVLSETLASRAPVEDWQDEQRNVVAQRYEAMAELNSEMPPPPPEQASPGSDAISIEA